MLKIGLKVEKKCFMGFSMIFPGTSSKLSMHFNTIRPGIFQEMKCRMNIFAWFGLGYQDQAVVLKTPSVRVGFLKLSSPERNYPCLIVFLGLRDRDTHNDDV